MTDVAVLCCAVLCCAVLCVLSCLIAEACLGVAFCVGAMRLGASCSFGSRLMRGKGFREIHTVLGEGREERGERIATGQREEKSSGSGSGICIKVSSLVTNRHIPVAVREGL
jgi:hypothetical protein